MTSTRYQDAPVSWPTDPRGRLIGSMTAVAAERGYAATHVRDVIARAGISSRTFYAYFESREACFFAAYDAIVGDLVYLLLGEDSDQPAQAMALTLQRLLEHFARWPAHAQLLFGEVLSAGPKGAERHESTMAMLAERLASCETWQPGSCESLERVEVAQALIGAMVRMVQMRLNAGEAAALPGLFPSMLALTTRVALAA